MKKTLLGSVVFMLAGMGAQVFAQEAETIYEKNVPAGETVELTAEEVAAAAGKTFVKTGAGTLKVGDVMTDFTGDIRVTGGIYEMMTRGALGTTAGATYAEGGTLKNYVSAGVNGTTVFPDEAIHLSGTGYDGNGALYNTVACCEFRGKITLDDAATIRTDARFDVRYRDVNMNNKKLTIKAKAGNKFYLVGGMTIQNPGDIEVVSGGLEFQGNVNGTSNAATVTMRENTALSFWSCSAWIGYKFIFEKGVKLECANGPFKYSGTDNRSVINSTSTVDMRGILSNVIDSNCQWQIRAFMTGDGGISGGKGGYIQLFCPSNNFKGGLDISGVIGAGNNPVGGLVVYDNGAIPYGGDATALKLRNASLQLRDKNAYNLPEVIADGRVVISNMATVQSCVVPGIQKKGAGELTVFGPLNVTGDALFESGSVKVATRIPAEGMPGLFCKYMNQNAGIPNYVDMGIAKTGVEYAYKAWPSGKVMGYKYEGYIHVPEDKGEEVTCNFISSIARACKVTIGGIVCAHGDDQKNEKDNIKLSDWGRFFMYKPVTLKAGWQPISIVMENYYNETRGPQDNTDKGWVANFGIGVDWDGRCVTNTANYVKLLNSDDVTLLRPWLTTEERDLKANESQYRMTFGGGVTFGAGVEFDIGDEAPYLAMNVASITGLPVIKNGAIKVGSSNWTIRKSDILDEDNTPRNIPSGLVDAEMKFASDTVTIAMPAEDVAALSGITQTTECEIIADASAFGATKFVLADDVKATGFRLRNENGKIILAKTNGMTVIIR